MQKSESLLRQLEAQRRTVDVEHFDITTRELVRMIEERELQTAPDYQRKFRWREPDESRLIESVFLGLPVPSVFVATNANSTWEVVDGLQRLSTLVHYLADSRALLSAINKAEPLRIEGLERLTRLNGKTFKELPTPLRLAFGKRAIRVTALSDKSDYKVRFDMFERLNRGGLKLTEQEVRAVIYRGDFNALLSELAALPTFQALVKLQPKRDDDGTREELVLKFFAYLNHREAFDGLVKDFLNDYMEGASAEFDIAEGRKLFKVVAKKVLALCGGGPFLRPNYGNTPLNQLEAVLVAAGELAQRDELEEAAPVEGWLSDAVIMKYSTKGTNTVNSLKRRIARATELLQGAEVMTTADEDAGASD
jgi:hypothetical protein